MGDRVGLSHNFVVGQVDNGKWLAVSTRAPYFCLEGESESIVVDKANRALAFYFGVKADDGQLTRSEPKGKRAKSLSTFRKARKIDVERKCA
jgi:hypothetical protein